jgi:hypothetical protein
MSTKVYYAWRVPIKHLNSFTDRLHEEMRRYALQIVLEQYVVSSEKEDKIAKLFTHFKKIAESPFRDSRDIECGFNMWIDEQYVYIIPIAQEKFYRFFKKPNYAKNYCYWDNTDKDDRASSKDWRERGKIWEKLSGHSEKTHNARRFYHAVIDIKTQGHFDWEIIEEILKYKKSIEETRNSSQIPFV